MKIQFEGDLDYQNAAISSIINIFEGQEKSIAHFSIQRQDKHLL